MPYIGISPNFGNLSTQAGTGDGSDVTPIATLDYTVATSASIGVYLDGVRQVAGTDYVANGTTLTFTTAPPNLVKIEVVFFGLSVDIGTPGDNTVTNANIDASAAIATSKLSGAVTSIASHGLATSATTDMTNMGNAASGTLVVARGGTGATTHTANNILVGNGTSAIGSVAPSTSGNVLTSNGSAWASTAPAGVTTKQISAGYDLTTASGTQDITGFGFDPVAMFYMCLVSNSDDWMFGFTDFTNNRTMHTKATTTAVLSATGSMMRAQIGVSDNQDGTVEVITDGIRITWTKNGSPTGTLNQYLIGFK